MKSKPSVAVLAAVLTSLCAAAAAGAATITSVSTPVSMTAGSSVSCGSQITGDVTLEQDLTCTGDGLEIVASSAVTVNLNGHTIRGSGSGTGVIVEGPSTVRNGTVSGFAEGIDIFDAPTLTKLNVVRSGTGIQLEPDSGLTISDSTVSDNGGDGIVGSASQGRGLTVSKTSVVRNGGYGIRLGFFEPWSVSQTVLSWNGKDGLHSDDASGQITDSIASNNGGNGISILDDLGPAPLGYFVKGNTAQVNGGWGISVDVGLLAGVDGGGNVASHNRSGQCLNVACVPFRS